MTSKNITILSALIVILFIGGFFYITQQPSQPSPQAPQTEITLPDQINETKETTIEINAKGFLPEQVRIKAGDKVTWVNNDTDDHQVSSDLHPTHLIYPPINTIDTLAPAQKKSLTFPEKGTYKYHDHLNPQFRGSVTVE